METTSYNPVLTGNYTERISRPSLFARFFNWCANQEESRMLWIGLALAGHGCFLTPLTIFVVVVTGNSLALFMAAMSVMALVLVPNLAALSTKITIPVLIASILIDLGIIAVAISMATGA